MNPQTSEQQTVPVTAELCAWVHKLQLSDIPEEVITRTKYLILDGLACALVGSRLPWSETATKAVLSMESAGTCSIWGYDKVKLFSPVPKELANTA